MLAVKLIVLPVVTWRSAAESSLCMKSQYKSLRTAGDVFIFPKSKRSGPDKTSCRETAATGSRREAPGFSEGWWIWEQL